MSFDANSPNLYFNFPYVPIAKHECFMVALMKPNENFTKRIFVRNRTMYFNKSPKLSIHQGGRVHIKGPSNERIPGLFINTYSRLDEEDSEPIFRIAIKNPQKFQPFNATRDDGTSSNKNLILEFLDAVPEAIQFIGRRIILSKTYPYFEHIAVNHPVVGVRGDGVVGIFFLYPMPSENNRVLILLDVHIEKFECDESTCAFISAGSANSRLNELMIRAPSDSTKVQYSNHLQILLKRVVNNCFAWWS